MSEKIAILYATVDGQTLKISNKLVEDLEKSGNDVHLFEIDEFKGKISDFSKFIIGSSIRYGVHNEKIIAFINKNESELDKIKSVFFSVNLVARKPEKNEPDTNPYVVKFFKKITWKPKMVEVFAGMLDYKKYGRFDRLMIRFIMWMTKGPTDPNAKIEYTKWDRVSNFAAKINSL